MVRDRSMKRWLSQRQAPFRQGRLLIGPRPTGRRRHEPRLATSSTGCDVSSHTINQRLVPCTLQKVNLRVNHLEQLVSEWLQYNGYFVRVSVQVGARANGGYEGELDVVALNPMNKHLLHVECSLDAHSTQVREKRFTGKFERGRKHIRDAFRGVEIPETLEQVLVLQFASGNVRSFGGARLVTVREFVHEMFEGLDGTSPASKAVPSNLPLLRTIQLAADAVRGAPSNHRIIRR